MNYWPRWISAIKKRTATLSLMQMGAYDRLLDHYYAEEQPLPGTLDECYRIVSATTSAEKDAVRFVLGKFFVLDDGTYRNERADEELAIGLKKIAAAQSNGKTGGRPKGSTKKPTGLPAGNPPGDPEKTGDEPTSKAPHHHLHQDSTESIPPPEGGGDAEDLTAGFTPTPAGAICKALRMAGIGDTNPSHPTLLALIEAGATVDEFTGAAPQAAGKSKPFSYVLSVVTNERQRAAGLRLHQGAMPQQMTPGQRAAHERIAAAVPGLAAKPATSQPLTEVFDVKARLVG